MGNLSENRINQAMISAQTTAISTAITSLNTQFNFLVTLTEEERLSKMSVDVANKVFIDETLDEMQQTPSVFPSYVSATNLQKDVQLIDQLDSVLSNLRNLVQRLEDTRRQAAHEAMEQSLAAYKGVINATEAGVPMAQASYDRLKARFNNTTGRPLSSDPTTTV